MFRNLMSLNCQSLPLPAHAPLPPSPPPPPHTLLWPSCMGVLFHQVPKSGGGDNQPGEHGGRPAGDPLQQRRCLHQGRSHDDAHHTVLRLHAWSCGNVIRDEPMNWGGGWLIYWLIILSCDSTPGAVVTWYVMSPWIGVGDDWFIGWSYCPATPRLELW